MSSEFYIETDKLFHEFIELTKGKDESRPYLEIRGPLKPYPDACCQIGVEESTNYYKSLEEATTLAEQAGLTVAKELHNNHEAGSGVVFYVEGSQQEVAQQIAHALYKALDERGKKSEMAALEARCKKLGIECNAPNQPDVLEKSSYTPPELPKDIVPTYADAAKALQYYLNRHLDRHLGKYVKGKVEGLSFPTVTATENGHFEVDVTSLESYGGTGIAN